MNEWKPRDSIAQPPEEGQWLFYYFEPFSRWYTGTYDGFGFTGRYGFCDVYDAPYWHPMMDNPIPIDKRNDML
jgi:hypothetical protein